MQMETTREEILAHLANDVFNKRQRLLQASQASAQMEGGDAALEAEYRAAELEYSQAKAAFARAMKMDKPGD